MNYEFRTLTESDAQAFLDFKKQISKETQNTLLYPERTWCVEEERARITSHLHTRNTLDLCAFDNNHIVGYLNYRVPMQNHPWVKHVASFGMMVLKSHWGKGIGTKLLQLMEDKARSQNIKRIEAAVREQNLRALQLYKRHKYNIEGLKVGAAFINGEFCNEYIIAKNLDAAHWLPPMIETKRMILRPIRPNDAQSIFEYTQRPEITEFTSWNTHTKIQDVYDFIYNYVFPLYDKKSYGPLAICLQSQPDKVLGTLDCVWVSKNQKIMEIAYALHPDYWGKGLMTEAAQALIQTCFTQTDVERIQGRCKQEHIASRKVMEKLGFSFEGTIRSSMEKNNQRWSLSLLAITREDFFSSTDVS